MSSSAGVYVFRARKPGARMRIPLVSTHFAYVGESRNVRLRIRQHVTGGGRYHVVAKPWNDLDPRVVLRIPLPPWKWLLRLVETLVILATWPVYNISKNRWNPRRIPLAEQWRQRDVRDRGRHPINVRPLHVYVAVILAVTVWAAIALWSTR